ncbi:hypothetical protein K3495_g2044 [Podosphaera aphanis]|nr:hypothetical protein K3495_g2044 [Podosphaera aphanis]
MALKSMSNPSKVSIKKPIYPEKNTSLLALHLIDRSDKKRKKTFNAHEVPRLFNDLRAALCVMDWIRNLIASIHALSSQAQPN